MGKSVKRGKRASKKPLFVVVLLIAVAIGGYFLYTNIKGPTSGRYTFTFTQLVGQLDESGCVHLAYYGSDYCIDDWGKVYSVMDATNRKTSSTQGTTVKIVFEADFHIGSKIFLGDTEKPTIFLDKVYSATATKQ